MQTRVRLILISVLFTMFSGIIQAQHHEDRVYIWPEDPLVKEKLAWWQDLKFGLLMHWGPYSQWGVVESWSICPEDEDWCARRGPYAHNYFEYRKAYEQLPATFNPLRFDPDKWADAAARAGMKYMVFTTKHHDGFCMFDTRLTDYRITAEGVPFSDNPKANITLEVFNAFRERGFGIGAYFSKPDWHCPDYWDPYFPPTDRNVNYDRSRYPEKWERYMEFTKGQIRELLTGYGKVDILWLDGGWVKKCSDTVFSGGRRIVNQDIDMPGIAAMARSLQPGILVVDRAVEGPEQNYLTPEQKVPGEPLEFPWETCMTMGNSWSYVPGDTYKTPAQLIHLLCRIVSRGGNFLLNIGPGPDGEWAPEAYHRLEEIGKWMDQNGKAIYNTRPVAPYEWGNCVYTQGENELFVICLNPEGKEMKLPEIMLPQGYRPVARVAGSGEKAGMKKKGEGKYEIRYRLAADVPAVAFSFERQN